MRIHRIKLLPLLKEAALKWYTDNCIRLGASLSYYTLFSLFPLILVVLTIVRLLFVSSDSARDAILDALASVTGGFREDFVTALEAAIHTRRASGIVGTATLLLGASWVFGELMSAFNVMWNVESAAEGGPLEFLHTTLFSFALVLSGAFLLLVSMIISAILAALGTVTTSLPGGVVVWRVSQLTLNIGVLTLVFALLFKYLPRTYVAWGDVWLGAALTSVLWTLLQSAISFYIALSSYEDYGAIGAILALVVWVYLSSQVVFLGGEFTNVYARHYGSRADPGSGHSTPIEPVQPATAPVCTTPSLPAPKSHVVSGATGVTLGVLGTVSIAMIALVLSIARAVRRILTR